MSKDKNIQLREKIDQLNQQAWDIRVNDSLKAFKLSQRSLEQARKINYKKGMAEATRSMGFCYVRLSKNKEALPLLKESLSLFEELNEPEGQAVVYEYLAVIKRNQGELGTALDLLFKAVALSQQTGSTENEAIHHYQIGVTYKYLGNFDKALDSLFKSISIHKENKNRFYQSYPINVIGSIYFETGDYKKALEYFKEGLKLRQEFKDKLGEAGSLDNIGYTLFKLKKYTQALTYCKKGLAISKATDDKRSQASALQHLAEIHAQAGDTKQAIISSNASRKIRKVTGDKRGEAEILLFLANLPQQNPQKVVAWIQEALQIAKETRSPDIQSRAHHCLYNYYKQEGRFKDANTQLEKHYKLEKELQKNSVNQKIANLEITRKAEETRKEAALVMDKNEELTRLNKELEIETSLERVRTVAMGMKTPEDMLDVCTTISLQLYSLGVKEVRNVQTAIFNVPKGTYMNYEYYAKHKKTFITETCYTDHKVARAFAAKMLKGKGQVSITHIKGGKNVKEWLAYQKKTNVFIDTWLEKATSLNYYWHSLGPVALGISTYTPLSKEDSNLFQRFLKVFELAYRRYLDIEKAVAQAREAKIEVAVERVRANALAMHRSEDLHGVVTTLSKELIGLEIPGVTATTIYLQQDDGSIRVLDLSTAREEEDHTIELKLDKVFRIEDTHPDLWIRRMWNSKKHYHVVEADEDDFVRVVEWLYSVDKKGARIAKKIIKEKSIKRAWLPTVKLEKGRLNIDLLEPPGPEVEPILIKMGAGFDLAYKRFRDLQKAEAQTKEAKIEAALEKVRAQAMGMQKPADILNVCKVMFQELPGIGFSDVRNTLINFWDDANSSLIDYDYSDFAGGNVSKLSYSSHPVFEQFQKTIRRSKDAIAQLVVTKDQLASWKKRRRESGEYEDPRLNEISALYYYFYSIGVGSIGISTFGPLSAENLELLKRFRNVFDLAYRRYLDIEKAEAQAREAQIELALERVRARTMAMQHSEELSETVTVLFDQFQALGESPERMAIEIVNENENVFDIWATQHGGSQLNQLLKASLDEPYVMQKMYKAWKEQKRSISIDLQGKELEGYYQFLKKQGLPVDRKIFGTRRVQNVATFSKGIITIITPEPRPAETIQLLERFAKVFDGTYTRFLDLQKAEAQAREAQIELALERVRARTMAMQKSDELEEVVALLYKQFQELDFGLYQILVSIIDMKNHVVEWWSRGFDETALPQRNLIPMMDHPFPNTQMKKWQSGMDYYAHILEGDIKKSWEEYLFTQTDLKNFPKPVLKQMRSLEKVYLSDAFMKHGVLQAAGPAPLPDDKASILKRFAKVLDLAYTRYLDIEQAQAQAREAQIEVALERVRARTMAMQKSDELAEAATLVFQQFSSLGMLPEASRVFFSLIDETTLSAEVWTTKEDGMLRPGSHRISIKANKHLNDVFDSWKARKLIYHRELRGKELTDYIKYLASVPNLKEDKTIQQVIVTPPDRLVFTEAFFEQGTIGVVGLIPLTQESHQTLIRFARVFEQTYSRFLDLQKAESQTKESHIQLALERVRARTMAMQHSDELKGVIETVYNEFSKLDIVSTRCLIWIMDSENNSAHLWMANQELQPVNFYMPYHESPPYLAFLKAWKERIIHWQYDLQGQVKKDWDHFVFNNTEMKHLPDLVKTNMQATQKVVMAASFYSFGCLQTAGPEPLNEEQLDILNRFAKVFDLTYTRFNDLQKAEAQAREARIETALEKVRSRSLAMHTSTELGEVATVVLNNLQDLGYVIDSGAAAHLAIFSEDTKDFVQWSADPVLSSPVRSKIPYTDHPILSDFFEAKVKGLDFFARVYTLEQKNTWFAYAFEHSDLKYIPEELKQLLLDSESYAHSIAIEKNSAIIINSITGNQLSDNQIDILKRFARVFEQAYIRFLDLQKAEAQAREAQIETALERVRSRTMGMQKSDELKEVIQVVYEQFVHLNINIGHTGFVMDYKTRDDYNIWIADPHGAPSQVTIPYFDSVYYNRFNEAKEQGTDFFATNLNFEEKNKFYQTLFKYVPGLPEEAKEFYFNCPGLAASTVLLENIGLYIENFSGIPYTDEENNTLMRFGKVFQQTYTRFLDLKKAEAQAKEAQIEAALEKVRSRSLAMHKSDEIKEVVKTTVEKIQELDIEMNGGISLVTFDAGSKDMQHWLWIPGQLDDTFKAHLPWFDHVMFQECNGAREQKLELFAKVYSGNEKDTYFDHLFNRTDFKGGPEAVKAWVLEQPYFGFSFAIQKNSGIFLNDYTGKYFSKETNDILVRFSKVFEQSYIRFLDLQKAEAQAREAQIEAALERIRARSLAMHQSEELSEVIQVVSEQLQQLNFVFDSASFTINNSSQSVDFCLAAVGQPAPAKLFVPYVDNPILNNTMEAARQGLEFIADTVSYEEKNKWVEHLIETTPLKHAPEERKNQFRSAKGFARSAMLMKHITLAIVNYEGKPYSDADNAVFIRFARAFEQAYTRFLDLQKAEAQSRESKIEAALEKVRSRSLAMHKSEELREVVTTVFDRLKELDIQTDSLNLDIFNENLKDAYLWTAVPGHSYSQAVHIPYTEVVIFKDIFDGMIGGQELHSKIYSREEKDEFFSYLFENTGFRDAPKERKDMLFATDGCSISVAYAKNTAIIAQRYTKKAFSADENEILKRFAKVFEQSYIRFKDLQKAEAQSREAQIEASLERIRAKAMAMHHSDELDEVLAVLFEQFDILGILPMSTHMTLLDLETNTFTFRETGKAGRRSYGEQTVAIDSMDIWKEAAEKWKMSDPFTINRLHFPKEALPQLWQVFHQTFESMPEGAKIVPEDYPDGLYHTAGYCKFGYIGMNQTRKATEEEEQIVLKFATEFGRFYQRFLDLKKAEAQAREAQIEAALERVRYSAMAMQNSTDVGNATSIMFTELDTLGIETFRCGIAIVEDEELEVWSMGNTGDGRTVKGVGRVAIRMHPLWQLFKKIWDSKQDFLYYYLAGQEKEDYIKALTTSTSYSLTQTTLEFPDLHFQSYHFDEGAIFSFSEHQHSEVDKAVMKRFAKVFSLTFRRYLDLKQAEAQAREAKIEASLERVRSRAMGMQRSEELSSLIGTVFAEITKLDIVLTRCLIMIYDPETRDSRWWMANSEDPGNPAGYHIPYHDHEPYQHYLQGWKQRSVKWTYELKAGVKRKWDNFLFVETELAKLPHFVIEGMKQPDRVYLNASFNNFGNLTLATLEPLSDEHFDILLRFAKVFDLTYTRFNDLKQAEAQAKEAQIQLALERVRARTMAMQHSDELAEASVVLFQQFAALGQTPDRISIGIVDEQTDTTDVWATDQAGTQINIHFKARNSEATTIRKILDEWRAGKKSTQVDLQGEELQQWVTYLRTELGMGIDDSYFHGRRIHQVSFFSQGWLNITTLEPLPAETLDLLDRFADVFNLTYTRFTDLKKAEAQTREAKVEASLERVRAKAMGMHSSEDLMDTINLFYHEVEVLSITPRRCGVSLINKTTRMAELSTMTTTVGGESKVVVGHLKLGGHPVLDGAFESWALQKEFRPVLRGNEIRDYYKVLNSQVDFPDYPADEVQYGYYFFFPEGLVFAWTHAELAEDALQIYRRFTSVLSLTYRRYKDLKDAEERAEARLEDFRKLEEAKNKIEATLHELKATQTQLIQSEKMASLGELTAGIAHEIQNPLNFVNNFSEVSNELLDEMVEEVRKGNFEEVQAIVNDVKQNLEKINHHGKRADGIVKGMLQHSRSSSGQKELTDINALADEYLRLAYHGLRAKDKTFNAKFETALDPSLQKVTVVPQDIGRVILNLITNAFYVVAEKKRASALRQAQGSAGEPGYEPTVSVSTKNYDDKVEVSVKDNGSGMPPHVLEKIFQPFFTTKPTGQGTGLGLSLSYDIVKAHGGELRVETKEGEGSTFIIQLHTS